MKGTYIQPKMIAVKLHNQSHLMEGSTTFSGARSSDQNLTEEESITFIGGPSSAASRVKGTNFWDDEW